MNEPAKQISPQSVEKLAEYELRPYVSYPYHLTRTSAKGLPPFQAKEKSGDV